MDPLFENFLGNPPWRWLVAAAVAFGILFLLLLLRSLARKQYARLAATPEDEFLELPMHVVSRTTVGFLLIASVFLGLQTLELPPKFGRAMLTIITIASCWQIGLWATTGLVEALARKQRKALAVDRAAAGSITIIGFMARLTIWALVLLLTLDN